MECMRILSFLVLASIFNLQAQTFTSSNLPIIVIDTDGQSIPDDPKVNAHMGIIYNGAGNRNALANPFNNYNGLIAIELRGNVTQSFPKLSYSVETRDQTEADLKVSLLGMPEESDWVLAAAYLDKTFVRDPLAFFMSRSLNRWASRTVHCELVLNGVYQGIYIMEEKIKRDKNRVDIAKLTNADNTIPQVTGGFIYEVAQSGVDFGQRRRFVEPNWDDVTSQQTAYVKKFDDDFRQVMSGPDFDDPLKGYPAWIDIDAFIDEILMQEACKNSDAYGWSSYFHKDRSAKLKAGPLWDFDQALSNSTFNDGPNSQEWNITKSLSEVPFFWKKLFNEPVFRSQLSIRWMELRSDKFKTSRLVNFIDSVATTLDEAQTRNFVKWKTLGVELFRSTPGYEDRTTYQHEVNYLKTFLTNRLTWMDQNLSSVLGAEQGEKIVTDLLNYPNPSTGATTISYNLNKAGFVKLTLYDMFGKRLETLVQDRQNPSSYEYEVNTQLLTNGVYIFRLEVDNGMTASRKMVVVK